MVMTGARVVMIVDVIALRSGVTVAVLVSVPVVRDKHRHIRET